MPSAPSTLDTTVLAVRAAEVWTSQVVPAMKSFSRAIVAATRLVGARDGSVVLAAPNDVHRSKCLQYRADIDAAVEKAVGARVPVVFVVDGSAADDEPATASAATAAPSPASSSAAVPHDEDVDLDELVDVPPEAVQTPTDRLLEAFPGSKIIEG